ncbi:hypothetical protein AeRB84_007556 [Aphanomyces euteiches]|nr:hypothetical protein AeRB84_007556 [Aphanomyces euteiches]
MNHYRFSDVLSTTMDSRRGGFAEDQQGFQDGPSYIYLESEKYLYTERRVPTVLEDGAIVDGGALSMSSKEAMALFAQYAAIGVLYGLIPALQYPIFNNYLKLEGYQTASYTQLVTMGWSFKVFFGMLSDCFPIFGYRRKSWILIGWTITMVSLIVMFSSSLGDPYCNIEKATDEGRPGACSAIYSKTNDTDKKYFNLDAPNNGTMFIMLSVLVSFGYVMADCAADAMVVEYAQREPIAIRGRVQTAIYTVRQIFITVASIVSGLGLNSPNYGGTFSFSLKPNIPYGICMVPCALVILTTIFVLKEDKKPGTPFREYIGVFWNLLQQRVMWQVCAFRFINNTFYNINTTASSPIYNTWAKVAPVNDALSAIIGSMIYTVILIVMGKWGLQWNWRICIAAGTLGVMAIDSTVAFITIWNIFRNQWFFTGVGVFDQIPSGLRFIVSLYCAVEIADVGNEGATYGLVTTVANLAIPVASVIYKITDSHLRLSQDDIKTDSTEVRTDVTISYLTSYCSKIFSLFWLFLLPPQRGPMQELKSRGSKSKLAGALLVVTFLLSLAFSITSSIMSIFPSTKCYRIAGGNGILDPTTGKCPLVASRRG